LHARLDGSTPFRRPSLALTVRGRAWAIHDGILDEPWESPKMYKTVGVHAGVDTFTGEKF
jgi:acetoin utilization protein AcuC